MRIRYLGYEEITYPGYVDVSTGKTLTCTPGGTYDILPVSGPEIPADGNFEISEEDKPKESVTSQDAFTPEEGEQ